MNSLPVAARGLLNHKDSTSDSKICPVEDESGPSIVPIVGNFTFHDVASIVSGACTIVSILLSCVLIARHACDYSNQVQQLQVIRIILLVTWVSLFSFFIVWQENHGDYMVESLDFGCAIALSSFLLLMCDFVLSHPGGYDELFGHGAQGKGSDGIKSPAWLKRTWYSVLQFMPTSIIVWLATVITMAVGAYCKQSNSPHFAHIWIVVLKVFATAVAVISCLRFYDRYKSLLQQHKIIIKLFTFKGIIGMNALQTLIISILSGQDVLKPSKYLTYHDINTGLAALLLSCEMPIFAILIAVAFSTQPYKNSDGPTAGPLSAIVDAFNITDLLSAFIRGPMRLVRDQRRQILRQNSTIMVGQEGVNQDNEVLVHRSKRSGSV